MREFLKGLDLDKETIDTIMAEHGKLMTASKEKADSLKTALDEVKTDLTGQIEALKNDLAAMEAEHTAQLADRDFTATLSEAVRGAKGRDYKAVAALLDMDALKASKNQSADVQAAIDALKTEKGYLFESDTTPPQYASGTGSNRMMAGITSEDYSKMSYLDRLNLKQSNPEQYEKMKG